MKPSTNFQDYVFKDGKLLGEFDEMYQNADEVPWHQDQTAYFALSDIDIAILNQFEYRKICEIGCGYGYFLQRLKNELKTNKDEAGLTGIDISQTAIEKAADLFPHIRFVQADMISERPLAHEHFDLIVVKDVLWYICHQLDDFMENVLGLMESEGYLYVSQSFPNLTEPFVGKDVIPHPEALKSVLEERCEGITENYFHMLELHEDGPRLQWLGRLKAE